MAEYFRRAQVLVQRIPAGVLTETEDGYEFRYDKDYLSGTNPLPVSITLPLTDKVYASTMLFPFFDGLIPEGWLLHAVVRNWKLDPSDRFGVLLAACRDCIGDVSIERYDESEDDALGGAI